VIIRKTISALLFLLGRNDYSDMKIDLRTLMNKDAEPMLQWMHNPDVQKSFGKDFSSMKLENCLNFIENSKHHDSDDLNMAISTEDDVYAGTVSLKHIDHKTKSAEFAIVIHPDFQGNGVALQAMEQIAKIGFKVMGLQCIYLSVKKSNIVANDLYKKFGCKEIDEKYLREKGVQLFLPETEEELNWYELPKGVIKTKLVVNIDEEFKKEILEFYNPFFKNNDAVGFINEAYKTGNEKMRVLVNQIERWVTLADHIKEYRPGRDGLVVFMWVVLLESIKGINGADKNFYSSVIDYMNPEDRTDLIHDFNLTYVDYEENNNCAVHNNPVMSMDAFLWVLRIIRNEVAHEGNYWKSQVFHPGDNLEYAYLVDITSKKDIFNNGRENGTVYEYHFETKLLYERFRNAFVKMLVSYIVDLMNSVEK